MACRSLKDSDAIDGLQTLMEEVLPVDAGKRDEAVVVVQLIMASRTRALSQRTGTDITEMARDALNALGVPDPEKGSPS